MEWIQTNLAEILQWMAYIIGIATIIVKITPNETDNKILEVFVKIFEFLSGNTPPINSEKEKND
jgi:hypothetical protein